MSSIIFSSPKSLFLFVFLFIGSSIFSQSNPNCDDFYLSPSPPGPDNWASYPCANDGQLSVEARNGIAPFTYTWSNGATTSVIDSLASGSTHQVTVTDANGCTATSDELLIHHEIGIVSPHFIAEINGPTVRFKDNTNSNSPIVNWEWTILEPNDYPPMPNLPEFEYTFPKSDTVNVTLTVTDECGATASHPAPIMISVNLAEAFTFNIESAIGLVGDTLAIPVKVGNFNNILGFQKSIRLLNENTGKIVGFKNYQLASLTDSNFEQKNDGLWSAVWFNEDAISLPDEAVIYEILVVLTSEDGGCSLLTFDNSAINLQVIQQNATTNTPAIIESPWVRTAETCVATTISLAGKITTPYNAPIPNVTIQLQDTINTQTGENGQFFLNELPISQNYSLHPAKENATLDKVTALDLILILKHILNRETLDSPYKWIAADVFPDQDISVLDLITLQQYILGKINQLPAGNWVFIPKDYRFPTTPNNPLSVAYPTSLNAIDLESDQLDLDFYGVQIGDVSY